MSSTDDLAKLLGGGGPAPVQFGQGVLTAWNPANFANKVEFRDGELTNVPVFPGVDALSLKQDDNVALLGIPGSWFIMGRIDIPPLAEPVAIEGGDFIVKAGAIRGLDGAGNRFFEVRGGTDPEIFLEKSLISSLALEIFGEAIQSADADANVISGDTSGTWVSLSGGPELQDVSIGASGRALVIVSADVLCAPTGENGRVEGWMGFEVTGATSVAPDIFDTLRVRLTRGDGDVTLHPAVNVAASRMNLVSGLNPGLHTFTAQYRVIATTTDEAEFQGRNITVMPF